MGGHPPHQPVGGCCRRVRHSTHRRRQRRRRRRREAPGREAGGAAGGLRAVESHRGARAGVSRVAQRGRGRHADERLLAVRVLLSAAVRQRVRPRDVDGAVSRGAAAVVAVIDAVEGRRARQPGGGAAAGTEAGAGRVVHRGDSGQPAAPLRVEQPRAELRRLQRLPSRLVHRRAHSAGAAAPRRRDVPARGRGRPGGDGVGPEDAANGGAARGAADAAGQPRVPRERQRRHAGRVEHQLGFLARGQQGARPRGLAHAGHRRAAATGRAAAGPRHLGHGQPQRRRGA